MAKTQYSWNPFTDSVIEETDGVANVTATYTNKPLPFGPLVSQTRSGTDSQFHFDATGSTRVLTDALQQVNSSFTFDSSGTLLHASGNTDVHFLWNSRLGYSYSFAASAYYVRARSYSPSVARWTSRDALWLDIQPTIYLYGHNAFINANDPSGDREVNALVSCNCGSNNLTFKGVMQPFAVQEKAGVLMETIIGVNAGLFLVDEFDIARRLQCTCCDSFAFIQMVESNVWSSNRDCPQHAQFQLDAKQDTRFDPYYRSGITLNSMKLALKNANYDGLEAPHGTIAFIYDQPHRVNMSLAPVACGKPQLEPHHTMYVNFETCAACVSSVSDFEDTTPDLILTPCIKWGFRMELNENRTEMIFKQPQLVGPEKAAGPSDNLRRLLDTRAPGYIYHACGK